MKKSSQINVGDLVWIDNNSPHLEYLCAQLYFNKLTNPYPGDRLPRKFATGDYFGIVLERSKYAQIKIMFLDKEIEELFKKFSHDSYYQKYRYFELYQLVYVG